MERQKIVVEQKEYIEWSEEIRPAIKSVILKMRKYYSIIEKRDNVYYNLGAILNPQSKLSIYNMSHYIAVPL